MESTSELNEKENEDEQMGQLKLYRPQNQNKIDPELRQQQGTLDNTNNPYKPRSGYKYLTESEDVEIEQIFNRVFDRRTSPIHFEEDHGLMEHVSTGMSLASLITENLLCHPFLVLRRQCQVNYSAVRYHLIPITLVPVIIQIHERQGLTSLWKGIGSVLLVRGMTLGIEDVISRFTSWPKELDWDEFSCKSFLRHILLKCCSTALITPFYCASLVETVQSGIASDKPGFFDVFREGAIRMFSWGSDVNNRLLPIWSLMFPTVLLSVSRYVAQMGLKRGASRFLTLFSERKFNFKGVRPKESFTVYIQRRELETEINASFIAMIVAETIFYPLETVAHRIHLQGMRTIIDNLDNGKTVLPILTNYEGSFDCYRRCIENEAALGLFKGYGAVILQYVSHFALIRFTHIVFLQVASIVRKSRNKGKQT